MNSKNKRNIFFVLLVLLILYGAYKTLFNVSEGVKGKKRMTNCFFNNKNEGCDKVFNKNNLPPHNKGNSSFQNELFKTSYKSCETVNESDDCMKCVKAYATIVDPDNENISMGLKGEEVDRFYRYIKDKNGGNCKLTPKQRKILNSKK